MERRERTTGGGQCGKPRTVDPEEAQTLSGSLEEVLEGNVVDVAVVQPETAETREGRVLLVVVDHGVEQPLQPRERFVVLKEPMTVDRELLEVRAGLTEQGRQVAKEGFPMLLERRDVVFVPSHLGAALQARHVGAELEDLFDDRSLTLRFEFRLGELAGEETEARQRVEAKATQHDRRKVRDLLERVGDCWRDGMLPDPPEDLETGHLLRASSDVDADELLVMRRASILAKDSRRCNRMRPRLHAESDFRC